MKFLSTAQMRQMDEDAIKKHDMPGEVLMAHAGRGIAREILFLLAKGYNRKPRVLLLAGKGNNGGDAFVVARHLRDAGCSVSVWLAGEKADVNGDAKRHLDLMIASGISLLELKDEKEWCPDRLDLPLVDLAVDALLGTGSVGAPRGVIGQAVTLVNWLGRECPVVSIDIPSGMNADTGEAEDACVVADHTFTLGAPKKGFLNPRAWDFTGSIESVDIGLPESLYDGVDSKSEPELITGDYVRMVLPRRPRETNKGTYGRALLIGGAKGYTGAISLAARGAVASGAGLVTVYTPSSIANTVAVHCPESMVMAAEETDSGSVAAPLAEFLSDLSGFSAILIGPGMTTHPDTLRILRDLLRMAEAPLVIDADALNAVEGRGHWLDNSSSETIITPHPGEMARLLGVDVPTVMMDRTQVAHNAAEITGGLVALKGAGTIICDGKTRRMINLTGNPGMATGGTGDVLAGMVTGFVAQGLDPFEALAVAVYLHGKTGDLIAARTGQHGLKAGDLLDSLPEVMRHVL